MKGGIPGLGPVLLLFIRAEVGDRDSPQPAPSSMSHTYPHDPAARLY
jgi:hypothetical protein